MQRGMNEQAMQITMQSQLTSSPTDKFRDKDVAGLVSYVWDVYLCDRELSLVCE